MGSEDARLILLAEVVRLHHVACHTADVPPAAPIIAARFIQVLQKDLNTKESKEFRA